MQHETDRLIIREFEMSDWTAVHRYGADLNIMKYAIYHANSETDTRNFVMRAMESAEEEPRTEFERAVVLRDSPDTLIGGCGFSLEDENDREWRIGYCFHSDFWGNGYGTEVCKSLLQFGFRDCGAHRVSAVCDIENIGSIRVLEKSGLVREGRFREKSWGLGEWHDELQYAMLDSQWHENQSSPS